MKHAAAARWQGWASFALGLWLAMSPWICGYADDERLATGNAAFVGIALALGSHFEVALDADFAEWLNLAAGTWLAAAPFFLGFATAVVPAVNSHRGRHARDGARRFRPVARQANREMVA